MTDIIPAFYFDYRKLADLAVAHRETFQKAQPFAHAVFDGLIPDEMLDLVVREFPKIDEPAWRLSGPGSTKNTRNINIEKAVISEEVYFGPFTRHLMGQFNSHAFVQFIQTLTGVEDIIVDPTYSGCGLHSTGKGGKLMIHTDVNRHPIQKSNLLHQRYNMIVFLNKDWREEYGGHLELWNQDASCCVQKIAPIFNRIVIFDTGTRSFHGHPQPLACPEGRRRNTLAVYYYSLTRQTDDRYEGMQRQVRWVATTEEERSWERSHTFQNQSWPKIKRVVRKLLPPVVFDLFSAIRGKK